ncbi:MAG: WD40 repeat domain-containing protein [Elusimicrobiota bacterium]
MKKLVLFFVFIFAFCFFNPVFAEDKNIQDSGFAGIIPKLPKTPDDPELVNNFVYPSWGSVCQRYTYTVTYKDKEGRKPKYMRIIFNGKPIEMDPTSPKASLGKEDYQNGVRYEYKFVPNKLGSNFYYFEASNGLGKARAAIIDSPDNGPVLFESAFDKNEIALVDSKTGKKVGSYPTGKEWIGGIALSDDGKYLAVKTSKHIYLFDTNNMKKPLWEFVCEQCRIGDDVKGGIDISGDGSKIIAAFGERIALFDKSNNKPVWMYDKAGNSYNIAISRDGKYAAAATAGEETNVNSNLIILWNIQNSKPLWQYHAAGNFHDVSLSSDGSFVTGSTGCPDRRFYLFSKGSNKPLIKSDPLTRDSPVHRAKISADGTLMAVGSESDAGAVFLFKTNSKEPVWKFPTQNGSSVRALNFTPDGKFIGAATFGGQVYIFDSKSNQPVSSWIVNNAALGGIDISDDGSFIAAGGTDKKLHIFEKGKTTGVEIPFNEYVEEIDISANGKYIAAGTGGSVYFFESFNKDENKIFPCTTIIEPKSQGMMGEKAGSLSGKPLIKNAQVKLPGMLFGFGFLGSALLLGIFTALRKFKFLESQKKIPGKKVTIALVISAIIFLILTMTAVLFSNKNPDKNNDAVVNQGETKSGCGNTICEPVSGETKENCPQDCSGGD